MPSVPPEQGGVEEVEKRRPARQRGEAETADHEHCDPNGHPESDQHHADAEQEPAELDIGHRLEVASEDTGHGHCHDPDQQQAACHCDCPGQMLQIDSEAVVHRMGIMENSHISVIVAHDGLLCHVWPQASSKRSGGWRKAHISVRSIAAQYRPQDESQQGLRWVSVSPVRQDRIVLHILPTGTFRGPRPTAAPTLGMRQAWDPMPGCWPTVSKKC